MQIAYTKMQGAANQILVVDNRERGLPPPTPEQLKELGDARSGPGFDQLMWLSPARQPGSICSYRVFNNDGSEVEQCGNGVRCVARVLAAEAGADFVLDSPAGPVQVRVLDDGNISVNMGNATFERSELSIDGESRDVTLVSLGNPHCVLQVEDTSAADVEGLGARIERHQRFPDRINVGFSQVVSRKRIRLRVFERGAGETQACGTGACAAVVAGQQRGLLGQTVSVLLPGGQLMVSCAGGNSPVWLTGDAEILSEGTIDL